MMNMYVARSLILLMLLAPIARAAPEAPRTRASESASMVLDVTQRLGAMQIDKGASLGQGGQSPDPIWAGRAAEIRALHPRVIRLFLQEYFDELPNRGTYNFKSMDKVVDLVRDSGSEPMMNICFKPKILFPKIDPAIVEPNDWAEWERLIEAMVRHYKDRGTKITYWEVMNEPDIGEAGGCPYLFTSENYPPFYAHTAAAILRADPEARVGGPALANPNSAILPSLLDYCAKHQTPLHFISWHIYSSNPSAIRDTVVQKHKQLAKYPTLKSVETFLDEWNVSLLQPLRDRQFQPCYVAESIYQMLDAGLDFGCYYHIRDYHVDQETFDRFMTPRGSAAMAKWWNRNHQNSGLFDYENNVRPAYYSFKLLARLTGQRLKLESADPHIHGLATYDTRAGIYNLMFWNFSKEPARFDLHVKGLTGRWKATRLELDGRNSNPDEDSRLHMLDPLTLPAGEDSSVSVSLEPYGIGFWMIER